MRLIVGHPDEHESATANISCRRMHHRQRKSHSHRGIHGIATGLHYLDSSPRGQLMTADHDAVLRMHRRGRGESALNCARCQGSHQQQNQ
jgi:hypothetical protein